MKKPRQTIHFMQENKTDQALIFTKKLLGAAKELYPCGCISKGHG
jgi:hypothetical protein